MRDARRFSLVAVMCFGFCLSVAATAEEQEPRPMEGDGIWTKRSHALVTGNQCRQVWVCGPDEPVSMLTEETVTFTTDQQTDGTCNAQGSNVCRSCTALQPEQLCRWTIQQPPDE